MDNFCIIGRDNENILSIVLNDFVQYYIQCDYYKIMEEWKQSFQFDELQIMKQLELDFSRSSITFESNTINSFKIFKELIKKNLHHVHKDIFIICTQTVMSKPLEMIYKMLCGKIHLAEIETTNTNIDRKLHIHITKHEQNVTLINVTKNLKIVYIDGLDIRTLKYLSIDVNFKIDDFDTHQNTIEIVFTPFIECMEFISV